MLLNCVSRTNRSSSSRRTMSASATRCCRSAQTPFMRRPASRTRVFSWPARSCIEGTANTAVFFTLSRPAAFTGSWKSDLTAKDRSEPDGCSPRARRAAELALEALLAGAGEGAESEEEEPLDEEPDEELPDALDDEDPEELDIVYFVTVDNVMQLCPLLLGDEDTSYGDRLSPLLLGDEDTSYDSCVYRKRYRRLPESTTLDIQTKKKNLPMEKLEFGSEKSRSALKFSRKSGQRQNRKCSNQMQKIMETKPDIGHKLSNTTSAFEHDRRS